MASALGTVALTAKSAKAERDVIFVDRITVVGDAAYPSGGTVGLKAALEALTSDTRTIIAVIDAGVNGGYLSRYNVASDKLIALLGNGAGVLVEATGNISATTFTLVVLSV